MENVTLSLLHLGVIRAKNEHIKRRERSMKKQRNTIIPAFTAPPPPSPNNQTISIWQTQNNVEK